MGRLDNVQYTAAQQEMIQAGAGYYRVLAGAGTGKTKSMVGKIHYLLNHGDKPEDILVVTFSNAAAKELLERVEAAEGRKIPELRIRTFHAFFYDIVKEEYDTLGYQRIPSVLDPIDQYHEIDELLKKHPIPEWTGPAFLHYREIGGNGHWRRYRSALEIALAVFQACKKSRTDHAGTIDMNEVNEAVDPAEINSIALDKLVKLDDLFENQMKAKCLIDFDDMPRLAMKVCDDRSEILTDMGIKDILVDEFQDSSEDQIGLLRKLTGCPSFQSLTVVGDDYQSIYGFRDTSPQFIVHFSDYIGHDVETITYPENWRSTKPILDFAERFIAQNGENQVPKHLEAMRGSGVPVQVSGFFKPEEERNAIVRYLKARHANGIPWSQMAVLTRTKRELPEIADACTKAGIPTFLGAPEKLADNSRVKALMAFARLCLAPIADSMDALICANALEGGGLMDEPEEKVSEKTQAVAKRAADIMKARPEAQKEQFLAYVRDISMGDEVIESMLDKFEFRDFDEILDYCRDFTAYQGGGVEYTRREAYEGVNLVTAHSSKGREFKVVVVSLSHFPTTNRMSWDEKMELNRLAYVSFTRARDELLVTGQYVYRTEKDWAYNQFLHAAFDCADIPYDPEPEWSDVTLVKRHRKKAAS